MTHTNSPYQVIPSDLPNKGILFVDREKEGRSGHGGNTIVECNNGDIICFYSKGIVLALFEDDNAVHWLTRTK